MDASTDADSCIHVGVSISETEDNNQVPDGGGYDKYSRNGGNPSASLLHLLGSRRLQRRIASNVIAQSHWPALAVVGFGVSVSSLRVSLGYYSIVSCQSAAFLTYATSLSPLCHSPFTSTFTPLLLPSFRPLFGLGFPVFTAPLSFWTRCHRLTFLPLLLLTRPARSGPFYIDLGAGLVTPCDTDTSYTHHDIKPPGTPPSWPLVMKAMSNGLT